MSFFRKIQSDMAKDSRSSRDSALFSLIYLLFVTITTPFVFIFEIIPTAFRESGDWTRYWMNVLVTFFAVEILINYACIRLYKTHLVLSRDRPSCKKLGEERQSDIRSFSTYCDKCQLLPPPGSKTHHCNVCNKCVIRRDHHCYMVGTCIGYYNQRYFAVFTFYIGLSSAVGLYFIKQHLQTKPIGKEDESHWTNYVLPFTFVLWSRGQVYLAEFLTVLYCWTFCWTAMLGLGFFSIQMSIISRGITFHEFKTNPSARSKRPISENFYEVFGPCWLANFVMPMQLLFKQEEVGLPLGYVDNYYGNDYFTV